METSVLIIGGGATGLGVARDLSLRGIACILIEQADINSGASGANHGLLHSGARYVFKDPQTAVECKNEGRILKQIAPQCIEDTGGLFVGLEQDDDNYIADFSGRCMNLGLMCRKVEIKQALEEEPCLAKDLKAVFRVEDAVLDPFRLSLDNAADAKAHGARIMRNTKLLGFDREKGRIRAARVMNTRTEKAFSISADQYVNASGAWASQVVAQAGIRLPMIYSKGSLLITQDRINRKVINRLRPASDADILVPGGTVSIIGTTSVKIDSLEDIRPTIQEVDAIIQEGAMMIPGLCSARYIRAYAGVRPLVNTGQSSQRNISRNFSLRDHIEDGLDNLVTITGGKLTTFRLMAEKTCDLVAARMKNHSPCLTATKNLPKSAKGQWTDPLNSPRLWAAHPKGPDTLICECEMVSEQMVDDIVRSLKAEGARPTLREVAHRSRIGKGPCQGTFCSSRLAAHLYRKKELTGTQGMEQIRDFVNERWKGFLPLVRDRELVRAELMESFLCGLFGMETQGFSHPPTRYEGPEDPNARF